MIGAFSMPAYQQDETISGRTLDELPQAFDLCPKVKLVDKGGEIHLLPFHPQHNP